MALTNYFEIAFKYEKSHDIYRGSFQKCINDYNQT